MAAWLWPAPSVQRWWIGRRGSEGTGRGGRECTGGFSFFKGQSGKERDRRSSPSVDSGQVAAVLIPTEGRLVRAEVGEGAEVLLAK